MESIYDVYKRLREIGVEELNSIPAKIRVLPMFTTKYNASCGDRVTFGLATDNEGRITEIRFNTDGCLICSASTKALTMSLRGKTLNEAQEILQQYYHLVKGDSPSDITDGVLYNFLALRKYPNRIGCATLAADAIEDILQDNISSS